MKHDCQKVWSLRKEPEGPLVQFLDAFASHLAGQGYCRPYIGSKIRTVAKFSSWLSAKNIPVTSIVQKHVVQFFHGVDQKRAASQGKIATLHYLIEFFQQSGVISNEPLPVIRTHVQKVVDLFGHHLTDKKGLSEKTVVQYSPFIERFLTQCFGNNPVNLACLSGTNVIDFVKHEAARLSVARAKVATNALRAFLRYGVYLGDLDTCLIESIPTVASWSMKGIPRAISQEHIQAVLASCDRNTLMGKRDYAILMLLVHLGLRSGEIVSLTLDSIDWECGTISIRGKCDQITCLPIPSEIGRSIADYLKQDRSYCNDRSLFLRTLAPIRGLGAQVTIGTIVSAAITRAGVEPPSRGSHQFRHAVATNMLRQGASLTEIGCLLRHQHTKTTNIYAKVDLSALRPLSLCWPGGAQ